MKSKESLLAYFILSKLNVEYILEYVEYVECGVSWMLSMLQPVCKQEQQLASQARAIII